MIRKTFLYLAEIMLIIINIVLDFNINNYIDLLNECFSKNIVLSNFNYGIICFIICLISVLIGLALKLIILNKKDERRGIVLKKDDGTYGTANWLSDNELNNILGKNKVPGIILGKRNNEIIKLPFDSLFNKNIAVFGSSGSMKTIRIPNYKLIRTFKIQEIYYCNRRKR